MLAVIAQKDVEHARNVFWLLMMRQWRTLQSYKGFATTAHCHHTVSEDAS